jgi:hypothetical protein
MTIHNPYNEDLSLQGLEPGEDNPLEREPTYNPLQYCYYMPANLDNVQYEIAVKFQLQMHGETTPIDFIDPKTSKPHTVDFFPKVPEIGLEPEPDGPDPNLNRDYQIGENPYYLVPTVCRCKHIETGRLLTRDIAIKLISPEILQEAITDYRSKIEQDPNAPHRLLELLDMWDPEQAWRFEATDDTWDNEYEEEDDYYE